MKDKPPVREIRLDASTEPSRVFAPHGSYHATADGNIIEEQTSGPYNLEMARLYGQHAIRLYAELSRAGPFATITVFHGSMLMSPDAFEELRTVIQQLIDTKIVFHAVAHVAEPSVEGVRIMNTKFTALFASLGIPYRMFAHADEARRWIVQMLRSTGA